MMKNKLICIAIFICLPVLGHAESLVDKISSGAKNTVDVVGGATESAIGTTSDLAGKATNAVTDTVDSTNKSLQDEATPEDTRAKLDTMAKNTLKRLFTEQPESRALFDKSSGYAVFDAREASFYVVAGYGRGVAVNLKDDARIYMKMATAGAGASFGIGGFESQIIILFENDADFKVFVVQGFDSTAEAGTMTGDEKDQLALRFNEGKSVFILTKKGWKLGVKMTGSRYWPDDGLN